MMCLISRQSPVCFCATENCWTKLSTASPKRPVCDTGEFRNCTFSCSFMSARYSQRWLSWTTGVGIAQPRDCAVTFVTQRASERCLPRSCELLMHFREEWHQRGAAENQRDLHRETTRLASKDRDALEDSTRALHSQRPGKA